MLLSASNICTYLLQNNSHIIHNNPCDMQRELSTVYNMTTMVQSQGFTSDSALDQTLSNETDKPTKNLIMFPIV